VDRLAVRVVTDRFHLAIAPSTKVGEVEVQQTVAALKAINPDCVIPMHCTGDMFIDIVRQEMPDRFIRYYTGSRYIFGA
jgi:7,8-dihydropterin-6-yl-methyl-4-(beta-D-ribofuranosyl)aminobenzene 5'-phosphate synthase